MPIGVRVGTLAIDCLRVRVRPSQLGANRLTPFRAKDLDRDVHSSVRVRLDELRLDIVFQMAQAIDKLLLSWEPKPNLNEAISAQVQSLARALAATTDPGLSLTTVKDGLERILPEIVRTTSRS